MTRIEDELRAAADELRRQAADVDTGAALAKVAGRGGGPVRSMPLLVGAAAIVAAVVIGAAVLWNGDDQQVVADGSTSTASVDADEALRRMFDRIRAVSEHPARIPPAARSLAEMLPNVVFEHPDGTSAPVSELVVVGHVTSVEPWFGLLPGDDPTAPIHTDFDAPGVAWRALKVHVSVARSIGGGSTPEEVVVGLGYDDDPSNVDRWEAGLRSMGSAVFFLRSGLTPFDRYPSVYEPLEDGAFIAPVGDAGQLSLPAVDPDRAAGLLAATPTLGELMDAGKQVLRVLVVGEDGTVTDPTDAVDGSDTIEPPGHVPTGPDLAVPDAGFEITFDGVGDVRLGDALSPEAVDTIGPGDSCGYWGPDEPSHDGKEPLAGLVSGADTSTPRVSVIKVWNNPTYRTASGVGVGTTLASLQRIYGARLVVDRADGWEHPTGGLLASYQDVAAVRSGDHALTFLLRDDVVDAVKLSRAEFWGDDEGCA